VQFWQDGRQIFGQPFAFKSPGGPAAGDIAKVFIKSPQRDDDGEYFYGVLPPPSQARAEPSAPPAGE
jgi:hypothetical protein